MLDDKGVDLFFKLEYKKYVTGWSSNDIKNSSNSKNVALLKKFEQLLERFIT